MSESTSDDLHTAYAIGSHEAKKYALQRLAIALGVTTPDPQWVDLLATVRAQREAVAESVRSDVRRGAEQTLALAEALGVHAEGRSHAALCEIVRQEHSELTRLRVAVAHQQQELLMSRRENIE